jgi:hypothetical protein
MVETTDSRKFFTQEKNYPQLIEFANTFNAQISVVEAVAPQVLDMIPLATAISDSTYKVNTEFHVIETKIKRRQNQKNIKIHKVTNKQQMIRDFILEQFDSGKPVSIFGIAEHFKNYDFGLACYRNHLLQTRKELKANGKIIIKVDIGCYRMK